MNEQEVLGTLARAILAIAEKIEALAKITDFNAHYGRAYDRALGDEEREAFLEDLGYTTNMVEEILKEKAVV